MMNRNTPSEDILEWAGLDMLAAAVNEVGDCHPRAAPMSDRNDFDSTAPRTTWVPNVDDVDGWPGDLTSNIGIAMDNAMIDPPSLLWNDSYIKAAQDRTLYMPSSPRKLHTLSSSVLGSPKPSRRDDGWRPLVELADLASEAAPYPSHSPSGGGAFLWDFTQRKIHSDQAPSSEPDGYEYSRSSIFVPGTNVLRSESLAFSDAAYAPESMEERHIPSSPPIPSTEWRFDDVESIFTDNRMDEGIGLLSSNDDGPFLSETIGRARSRVSGKHPRPDSSHEGEKRVKVADFCATPRPRPLAKPKPNVSSQRKRSSFMPRVPKSLLLGTSTRPSNLILRADALANKSLMEKNAPVPASSVKRPLNTEKPPEMIRLFNRRIVPNAASLLPTPDHDISPSTDVQQPPEIDHLIVPVPARAKVVTLQMYRSTAKDRYIPPPSELLRKLVSDPKAASYHPPLTGYWCADENPINRDSFRDSDVYSPRWVRGSGDEREGLCTICASLSIEHWLVLRTSRYWYHMNMFHGVSSVTRRPLLPPMALKFPHQPKAMLDKFGRLANGAVSVDPVFGQCERCLKWIDLRSPLRVAVKVEQIYWWRHAGKCAGKCPKRKGKKRNTR